MGKPRSKRQKLDGGVKKEVEGGEVKEEVKKQYPVRDVREKARPNKAFSAFYKANFVESGYWGEDGDNVWDKFIEYMTKPLPTTFWITPTDSMAPHVKETLHMYRRKAEADTVNNITVKPIPWIPDDMAWLIDAPRVLLRKDPTYAPLHQFLITHTERGAINRQEEASMVPVHLLNITSGSRCLDMCAAPGSKTAQMLAQLASENLATHGKGCPSDTTTHNLFTGRVDYSKDEGVVIANDMSTDRVNILVHQIKRLSPLYPLALFTSHDSRYYPTVYDSDDVSANPAPIRFSRILADVMCSGDGTLRKAPHMWREWHPKHSIQLHKDQVLVAMRAVKLLQTSGRFVYSTCSLSPIENEAVVAHILAKAGGCLRLVDARKAVGIVSAPGMKTWKVMCPKKYTMFEKYEEAEKAGSKAVKPYHFPSEDPAVRDQMEKCLRLFPHMGDFGGFFVAVFEKIADYTHTEATDDVDPYDSGAEEDRESIEREAHLKQLQENIDKAPNDVEKAKAAAKFTRVCKNGSLLREVARYKTLVDTLPGVVTQLRDFFKLDMEFPVHQLICRYHLELKEGGELVQPHEGMPNQVLFCAKGVSEMLRHGLKGKKQLRVVNAGLRFLVKDRRMDVSSSPDSKDLTCRFAQEAMDLVKPFISTRTYPLSSPEDVVAILTKKDKSIPIESIYSPSKSDWKALPTGGCVVLLKTAEGVMLPISALRTKHAVQLYVDDNDVKAIREVCGVKI